MKPTITKRIGDLQRQATQLIKELRAVADDTGMDLEGDLREAASHVHASEMALREAHKCLKMAQARLIPREKVTDPWMRYEGIDPYMCAKCGGYLMYGGYDGIWCRECVAEVAA